MRTTIVQTPKTPAKAAPIMTPVLVFFVEVSSAGSPECVDALDVLELELVDEKLDVVVSDAVADGAFETETGESAPRQAASFETITGMKPELPPCRPCESVMTNINEVPAATLAVQLNDVEPTLGCNIKDSPPGIRPCERYQNGAYAPSCTFRYSQRL